MDHGGAHLLVDIRAGRAEGGRVHVQVVQLPHVQKIAAARRRVAAVAGQVFDWAIRHNCTETGRAEARARAQETLGQVQLHGNCSMSIISGKGLKISRGSTSSRGSLHRPFVLCPGIIQYRSGRVPVELPGAWAAAALVAPNFKFQLWSLAHLGPRKRPTASSRRRAGARVPVRRHRPSRRAQARAKETSYRFSGALHHATCLCQLFS